MNKTYLKIMLAIEIFAVLIIIIGGFVLHARGDIGLSFLWAILGGMILITSSIIAIKKKKHA